MSSSGNININKSSLAGLKAELLRKQEQVKNLKTIPGSSRISKPKHKSKWELSNKGVDGRNEKDAEEVRQEIDDNKRSRSALENKAKMYDKLTKNPELLAGNEKTFLVNFDKKQDDHQSDVEDVYSSEDDENDWIEFVDCLGRTKKCLKSDLDFMKEKDKKLKNMMSNTEEHEEDVEIEKEPKPNVQNFVRLTTEEGDIVGVVVDDNKPKDMMSQDMKREQMRQKWEEQEQLLLQKSQVHYQDILFDEARSHGVGYYEFSKDEDERMKQQQELNKARQETIQQQQVVKQAKTKREEQMKARLRAARRRKRERLGLPIDNDEDDDGEDSEKVDNETEEAPKEPELLKREEQKHKETREWDLGKTVDNDPLTQEEWVAIKRRERQREFAPPQEYAKYKKQRTDRGDRELPEAYLEDVRQSSSQTRQRYIEPDEQREEESSRGRRSEVPPPGSYGEHSAKKSRPRSEMETSIDRGLQFIRKQFEDRQVQKEKGLLDII